MVSVNDSRSIAGSSFGEAADVAVRHEPREQLAGVAGHLLVDALQAPDEAADVVVAVAVLPDLLDDLRDRLAVCLERLGRDRGAVSEVGEQRAVEAVEDDEVRLVRVLLALPRPAAEHLLEEDARLDRAQEDEELEVGDVDAGGEHVDRDDDAGLRPVAELADPLQRPVDAAGDLGDEGVALAEDVAGGVDELVGVRGVRAGRCRRRSGSSGSGPSPPDAPRRTS